MGSGLFDWMKGELDGLLDTLDQMAADGTLKTWATDLGNNILWVLQSIKWLGIGIYETWRDQVYPFLEGASILLGGWDVLGWIALGLVFSKTLFGIHRGILMISRGLALLLANPVIALAAAFALLAYVIYYNWDDIVAYFTAKIERIRKAFDEGLLNGVLQVIAEFNPFSFMARKAEELFTYLTGLTFADVTFAIVDAFDIDFLAIGEKWITDLWAGIASRIDALGAYLSAKFDAMIPDMPDWLRSGDPRGTAGIGGDSGYGGMAGAMDETAPFLVPAAPLRLRSPANGPSTNVNVGGITVNAAPGQSTEAVAREVRRQLSEAASIRAYLDDRGLHAD
jgi:hypothetical protein